MPVIHVVPHTHWDREWYEPFEGYRARLVKVVDRLLDLLDDGPGFRHFHFDGQTAAIEDYLEVRPEREADVARLVREGRIAVGPWRILMDEFLCSPETIVRNLQQGRASARRLGCDPKLGTDPRLGYIPDSFGHIAQMPQILRLAGMEDACVWRGVPRAVDRTAFWWEAPDGSRVRTIYLATSYSNGAALPAGVEELLSRAERILADLEPFHPGPVALVMNGTDHAGPQDHLPALLDEANAAQTALQFRIGTMAEYAAAAPREGLPSCQGELRSGARAYLLMGVASARVSLKQAEFRASRELERYAEPLAALAGTAPGRALGDAWRGMVENSAHDSICGCGIDAVARRVAERYEDAERASAEISAEALRALAARVETPADGVLVFNPSPFPRAGVAEVAGRAVSAPDVPGLGWTRAEQSASPAAAVHARRHTIDNGIIGATARRDGTLDLVHHPSGCRFEGLLAFEDGGDAGDEYNYSPPERDRVLTEPAEVEVADASEEGPLAAGLRVQAMWRVPESLDARERARSRRTIPLPVEISLRLVAGEPFLRATIAIDNRARNHRLRALFPLPFWADRSAADTAFHVTERGLRAESGPHEHPLPTFPCRRWVDVSDGEAGLAVIHQGTPEYELLDGPTLALTLLRCVGSLSRDRMLYRAGPAGPSLSTPGAQCEGAHVFHFAIYPHSGDWRGVHRVAEGYLYPLRALEVRAHAGDLPSRGGALAVEPDSIQLSALARDERGVICRIHNASPEAVQGWLRVGPPLRAERATLVDLFGDDLAPLPVENGRVPLRLRAWEIATVRLG